MIAFLGGLVLPDTTNRNADFELHFVWRFLFCIPALIAIIQVALILIFFNIETPKFLYKKQKIEEVTV
jgi:sugar phosphate permease